MINKRTKNKIKQKLYRPGKSKIVTVENLKSLDEMEKLLSKSLDKLKKGKEKDKKSKEEKDKK